MTAGTDERSSCFSFSNRTGHFSSYGTTSIFRMLMSLSTNGVSPSRAELSEIPTQLHWSGVLGILIDTFYYLDRVTRKSRCPSNRSRLVPVPLRDATISKNRPKAPSDIEYTVPSHLTQAAPTSSVLSFPSPIR